MAVLPRVVQQEGAAQIVSNQQVRNLTHLRKQNKGKLHAEASKPAQSHTH